MSTTVTVSNSVWLWLRQELDKYHLQYEWTCHHGVKHPMAKYRQTAQLRI